MRAIQITKIISSTDVEGLKREGEMREQNLVRRRYCEDTVIVSELFFKAWEGKGREERGERSGGTEGEGKRRNGISLW